MQSPRVSHWKREHRNGATTARIAKVPNSGGCMYVTHATGANGIVSELVDARDALEIVMAAVDRTTDCPQPCACPPWLESPSPNIGAFEPAPGPRRPTRWPTAEYNWERLMDLKSLLLWARSLLTFARHDTMKEALRLVIGEVEERLRSLLQEAGLAPSELMTVDLVTARARCRLKMISDMFKTAGLDAEFNPAAWP